MAQKQGVFVQRPMECQAISLPTEVSAYSDVIGGAGVCTSRIQCLVSTRNCHRASGCDSVPHLQLCLHTAG